MRAAAAGDDTYRDIRSWWAFARAVRGWNSPSWCPDDIWLLREKRGDLRVRSMTRSRRA